MPSSSAPPASEAPVSVDALLEIVEQLTRLTSTPIEVGGHPIGVLLVDLDLVVEALTKTLPAGASTPLEVLEQARLNRDSAAALVAFIVGQLVTPQAFDRLWKRIAERNWTDPGWYLPRDRRRLGRPEKRALPDDEARLLPDTLHRFREDIRAFRKQHGALTGEEGAPAERVRDLAGSPQRYETRFASTLTGSGSSPDASTCTRRPSASGCLVRSPRSPGTLASLRLVPSSVSPGTSASRPTTSTSGRAPPSSRRARRRRWASPSSNRQRTRRVLKRRTASAASSRICSRARSSRTCGNFRISRRRWWTAPATRTSKRQPSEQPATGRTAASRASPGALTGIDP